MNFNSNHTLPQLCLYEFVWICLSLRALGVDDLFHMSGVDDLFVKSCYVIMERIEKGN
jgi:hypothetical protein